MKIQVENNEYYFKPNGTVWKQLGLFTRDRSYPRRLEKFSGTEMDEGHIPPKYPLSPYDDYYLIYII